MAVYSCTCECTYVCGFFTRIGVPLCVHTCVCTVHAVKKVNVLWPLCWYEYRCATATGVSRLEPQAYCGYRYGRVMGIYSM